VLASVATSSLARINGDTEYGTILGSLMLAGFGAGLTIALLTSAAMNSVRPREEGIASAVFNVSINVGYILGVALQGAILTQRLSSELARSLSRWNLPSNLQNQLIADALHGNAKMLDDLPANLSPLTFHQAFNQAFVSGLHVTVLVASFALLIGAILAIAFIRPTFKSRSFESRGIGDES
jgi:MFS transporter, DHA2 family, methylenomycin A resistance protein